MVTCECSLPKKALMKTLMQNVLKMESAALERSAAAIKSQDVEALAELFRWLIQTGGQLVICGVGKSGLIAQKMAATFCSLGLPSFFLHPTEALHGDLGRVTKSDVLVLISKSGTTQEIIELMPYLTLPRERVVGLLGNISAGLSKYCGVLLDCSVEKEACLNDLAPTTSTTVALAMGDAMAVLYESVTGLSKEQFALNHPAGLLGKSLSLKVEKLLVPHSECPIATGEMKLQEALLPMTKFPVGLLAILNGKKLEGILVEGDIRRALTKNPKALEHAVAESMTKNPITVSSEMLAFEALKLMEERERPISALPVVDHGEFKGVLRLHDLLKIGFSLSKK